MWGNLLQDKRQPQKSYEFLNMIFKVLLFRQSLGNFEALLNVIIAQQLGRYLKF